MNVSKDVLDNITVMYVTPSGKTIEKVVERMVEVPSSDFTYDSKTGILKVNGVNRNTLLAASWSGDGTGRTGTTVRDGAKVVLIQWDANLTELTDIDKLMLRNVYSIGISEGSSSGFVLRMKNKSGVTGSFLKTLRTLKDMRRKLSIWKNEVKAKLEMVAEHDDLTKDLRSADDKLEIVMNSEPLHLTSDHGELFLGFCPIRTIFDYHVALGKRLKTKHNMAIVSSNIRTYLGNLTHTNAALIDAFQTMERNDDENVNLDDFPFLHNGMTLTGDDLRAKERDGKKVLVIERPKIINGAQSLFTYEQYAKKSKKPVNPMVLVKVVVPYPGADNFLNQVTMANNQGFGGDPP